jgi:SPP1 gp7 family putative phage head morphogenesis protein
VTLHVGIPESRRVYLAYDDRPFNKKAKANFRASRKAEIQFGAKLRRIARHIGDIVTSIEHGTLSAAYQVAQALAQYAEALEPWARAVLSRMHTEIGARDRKQWMKYAAEMGRNLRDEIESAPTGEVMRQLLSEQVALIKSIPLDAAKRVHELTLEGLIDGTRWPEIAKKIYETGDVTISRSNLIARTEVSRTAAILTEVRARHVGSTHFVWETVRDNRVRPDHHDLHGKTFAWDDPPVADKRTGARALPGAIYNCRCFARPLLSN